MREETPRRSRTFARVMRHSPTEAEAQMWRLLRSRRLASFKFRRQLPIGRYIVDFVCLERSLIIELDGSQHAESQRDVTRDLWLAERGFRILRVWNNDILARPAIVLDAVCLALEEPAP